MQNIKVIIGASYGDEGKGLAADFFGAQEKEKNGAVNVLTNGGPQRGHTVELADGRRHVFKHFGAASFRGAAAYYAQQFLVNPMEFLREFDELSGLHRAPEAYMHPQCRFTTPWDMLANQMLREMQGLHNSCGFGIWETVLRYQRGFGLSFEAFTSMSREDRLRWLRQLRDDGEWNQEAELSPKADEFFRSNGTNFDHCRLAYEEQVALLREDSNTVRNRLDAVFTFAKEAWDEGQEVLTILSRITASPTLAAFIARFGSDAYYEASRRLLFTERQAEIQQELRAFEESL